MAFVVPIVTLRRGGSLSGSALARSITRSSGRPSAHGTCAQQADAAAFDEVRRRVGTFEIWRAGTVWAKVDPYPVIRDKLRPKRHELKRKRRLPAARRPQIMTPIPSSAIALAE
jgi:hypothetical protein